jgi:hypothetical protein
VCVCVAEELWVVGASADGKAKAKGDDERLGLEDAAWGKQLISGFA